MKIEKSKLLRKINASLIQHLEIDDRHEVSEFPWHLLVNPARFDVMLKYLYAKAFKIGFDSGFAEEAYSEHLRIWNDFLEADVKGKNSKDKFIASFDQMLQEFSEVGFDKGQGYIPVGSNGTIIDGAHRSAACMAYKMDPLVVHFDHKEAIYGASFFAERGLSEDFLDAAAIEYAVLSPNAYMAMLFPVAGHKIADVERILSSFGTIVYKKSIALYNYGPVNVLAQIYKEEFWLGERHDGWPGALRHAKVKFSNGKPLNVYLFECDNLAKVRDVKARIRALYSLGNDSIHINDTHEQTVRLAQQLFNNNTIHLFNHGDLSRQHLVFQLHEQFKNDLINNDMTVERYCSDGSSVLALYGLREVNDFDYLVFGDDNQVFGDSLINNHNEEVYHYDASLSELVFDPRLYLYYDSIKYTSLRTALDMKRNRNEAKDRNDVLLGEAVVKNTHKITPWIPVQGGVSIPIGERIKRTLKEHLPPNALNVARVVYRQLKALNKLVVSIIDALQFGDREMEYRGFSLIYSPGTSLVKRLRGGKMYEPESTIALIRKLRDFDHPVVLDIGANIGLMSLNVLSLIPGSRIFAFEPGQHQFSLLSKTVKANSLQNQMEIFNLALSESSGLAPFAVHSTAHASGDGFLDTKRAGRTKLVEVETQKLDDWWRAHGEPEVHFVKIDTEGSELRVLRGATEFLATVRPPMLLEINGQNLAVYDFHQFDLLEFLTANHYELQTMDGIVINAGNLDSYLDLADEFIAVPRD